MSAAALATAAATVLGCAEGTTLTPVANGTDLHRATEIGFLPTEGPPLTQPREIHFAADCPDVTLLRLDEAGWSGHLALLGSNFVNEPAYRLVPVCVAPCDAEVSPRRGTRSEETTSRGPPPSRCTMARRQSGSKREGPKPFAKSGWVSHSVASSSASWAASPSRPRNESGGSDIGLGMLAIGAGALAVGIPLWLLNPPTKVAFEQ